jgi:hypothetical protein
MVTARQRQPREYPKLWRQLNARSHIGYPRLNWAICADGWPGQVAWGGGWLRGSQVACYIRSSYDGQPEIAAAVA